MKNFLKYYICNKEYWMVLVDSTGILLGIVIHILGIIAILFGLVTIMEEIKILNENIYIGIVFLISGYATYMVSLYIVKFICKISKKYF